MMLWTLLGVALVIFIVISFFAGEDSVLKPAGFKDALTKEEVAEDSSPGDSSVVDMSLAKEGMVFTDTAGEIVARVDAKGRAVDSAGQPVDIKSMPEVDNRPMHEPDTTVGSVLIFGDSMTILLARRLGEYGKKNGYMVHSVTWDGSSSVAWGDSDKVENYIREYKPDFIFVTLGSNEVFLQNFDARAPNVRKLVSKFGNIPYVWVGPPIWVENRGFDDMMERTLPKGHYFRTDMELQRGPDHIHPTPKAGVQWTDSVMRWMRRSPHPIKTVKPSAGGGSNLEIVYMPIKGKK